MKALVAKLIRDGYLKTPQIIEAFLSVDRQDFVPEEYKNEAYLDIPLPIGWGQTISQPATVAFMLELLQPLGGDKIMDVGAGSCWQTALLARIVGHDGKIFATERISDLLEQGKENIKKYAFGNIDFLCMDASNGLAEQAPFDKIIAAAAGDMMPPAWLGQLEISGRIFAPIKSSILLFTKKSKREFEKLK